MLILPVGVGPVALVVLLPPDLLGEEDPLHRALVSLFCMSSQATRPGARLPDAIRPRPITERAKNHHRKARTPPTMQM